MRRLLLPMLLVSAGYLLWTEGFRQAEGLRHGVAWILWGRVALGLVLILAWRLRRGRIAWTALAVAGAVEGMAVRPGPETGLVIGVLLPPILGVVAWLGEWWMVSRAGLLRLGALGLLGTLAYGIVRTRDLSPLAAWPQSGEPALVEALGTASAAVGVVPAVLVAFAVGWMLTVAALWRRRTPVEAGLLGASVALLGILGFDPRFFTVVAAAVLGAALVENAFSLAFHDGLTGLPARRALEERLSQVGRTYSLAMLDLDHFKKFNDKHGHEVGDQVLKLVAERLRKVGGGGEAFRYGGEEFTVVFAGRSAGEAKTHMDVLRGDIAGRKFKVRSPGRPKKKPKGSFSPKAPAVTKELKVTVSVGVAERSEKYGSVEEVMKAADKALYQSKKAGRNRVSVAK